MRIAALLALTTIAAACQPSAAPLSESTPESTAPALRQPINARFDCDGLILPVVFYPDRAVLTLADRDVELPPAMAASGARYSDGANELWNKGTDATLTIDGQRRMCRGLPDPWQEAGARGVDFRGIGQEPGWFIDIDDDGLTRVVYDYAEHELTTPTPPAVVAPPARTYTATAGTQALTVIITTQRCADGMSGEPFPNTVYVTIAGRELRGCGRPVAR